MGENRAWNDAGLPLNCCSKAELAARTGRTREAAAVDGALELSSDDILPSLIRENRRLQALVTELLLKNQRYREQHGGMLLD